MPGRSRCVVNVINQQSHVRVSKKRISLLARDVLRNETDLYCEVTILVTNDNEIRRFNSEYFGKDRATDVIAFNIEDPCKLRSTMFKRYLGDIVVSSETAVRQSGLYRSTPESEIELYVIHGILHLLGYRDKTEKQRNVMNSLQEKYLRARR